MKKHSCRMTDTGDKSVSKFLICVAGLKGIGKTTENKLYYLAREKGFID